jgi:hypothetical protein
MEQFLKVKIGADVGDLTKGVNDANRALSSLKQPVANAGATLTNFNRIVQDAPFGLIGIQNNIEPLFTSFGQLKAQAGGTGAALKALGASLVGPLGVVAGISFVTSLTTTLVQKYGSLGAAVEALTRANDPYFKQQQQIAAIRKEAVKDAGEEIAKLNVLATVSADTSVSLENRKNAANELLKVYKKYLPALTQEAILNGQAADAINKAKDAILNKALALAAEKKLAEVGAKILDNQLAQIDAVNRYSTAQKELSDQVAKANKEGLRGREGVNTQTVFFNTQLEKSEGNLKKLGSEAQNLQKEYDTLLKLATGFAIKAGSAFAPPGKESAPKITQVIQRAQELRIIPDKVRIDASETTADIEQARNFLLDNGLNIPINIDVPRETFDNLAKLGEAAKNAFDLELYRAKAKEFKAILAEGLAQPLGDLIFNFLDQGKVGFKEFADAAISSIKRIVAQLIATKIIQLIGNLVFPGAGGVIGKGIGSAIGSAIFGGVVNPNLSGLSGGGLALFGGVSFEIKGPNLVGVLNNTNASIQRAG